MLHLIPYMTPWLAATTTFARQVGHQAKVLPSTLPDQLRPDSMLGRLHCRCGLCVWTCTFWTTAET